MRTDDEARCYLNHLLAQHRRLHLMLRQMREAILESVQPDETPSFAEITRTLKKLREEMAKHFAEEEAGGCLNEAVTRCPALSSEAKRIEGEHPLILQRIDSLIEQAETLKPIPQNQYAIQRLFDVMYRQLQDHEAAENRLLAQGFGKPIDEDEADQPTLIFDI
jgi:hypothetical protein